jgi:hypothetical protein
MVSKFNDPRALNPSVKGGALRSKCKNPPPPTPCDLQIVLESNLRNPVVLCRTMQGRMCNKTSKNKHQTEQSSMGVSIESRQGNSINCWFTRADAHSQILHALETKKRLSTHSYSEPIMSSTKQEQLKQETFHVFPKNK